MKILIKKDTTSVAKQKKSRISAFILAIVCVFTFTAGAFIGGYFTKKSADEYYAGEFDKIAADLERIEYYADLTDLIDFAEENFYEDVTRELLMEYACRGLIDNLDAYSQLLTKEDMEYIAQSEIMAARMGKIGLTVSFLEAGRFCIREIAANSPAAQYNLVAPDSQKIMVGDFIEYVDGYYVEGLYQEDLTYLLSGLIGDSVTLGLYHDYPSGRVYKNNVTLVRAQFTARQTFSVFDFGKYSPELEGQIPDDIGYIRISSFTGTAASDFADDIANFKQAGKTKLILDLRGNGGGDGQTMCRIASYLIEDLQHSASQNVITLHFKDGTTHEERTSSNKYIYHGTTPYKIAVLVDGGTASASECVIGAMITSRVNGLSGGTCELFGTPTYGKGIGQFTYSFNDEDGEEKYAVKISVGEYSFRGDVSEYVYGATGYVNSIHGVGFSPKAQYTVSTVSHTLVGDEAFEMAVDYLSQLG